MNLLLMHMSDGLVSINISLIFTFIALVLMGYSIKQLTNKQDQSKIPMMAVMAAFVFAGQMINFTIPGTGSSGHLGGAILLCLILGPEAGYLSLCSVLIIQCLFFGDGGLLALGCNMFNMGVLPCFIAYPLIIKPILKVFNRKRLAIASILAAIVGLELGAFMVVIQSVASGTSGLPFSTFMALMLPIHLAIGLVEGIITALVTSFVYQNNPEIIKTSLLNQTYHGLKIKQVVITLGISALLIGGGLSLLASSNPDGLEWSILNITGDSEVASNDDSKNKISDFQTSLTILPDYNFTNDDGMLGTSFSGVVGAGITFVVVGSIGLIVSRRRHEKNN